MYEHSLAQSTDGVQCITSHILDNQAIEITERTVVSVLCMIIVQLLMSRKHAPVVFVC